MKQILNNLMKSINRWTALLISSLFFSLMHSINPNFSWMSFWNILLAGILPGLPYIYTKSLWLPIALHFSWNFFQGTLFVEEDQEREPLELPSNSYYWGAKATFLQS